ncbi:hypothetical protein I302_107733 [Kwoniella bestiolae CBS 10118]|uniref:Uncharacterized protein n=1 Tax=Kwoniella bestiolae CBS 10118 TaxID=1296100 RepID=A0A1B9FXQ5_9TREE|nr:hypothetical protein I302_06528 [Kwoniella bestiolae CBS 10118]OCF23545.1 hypothetical protein I302_06528 [Kwoniella bestiolae CBS 10118]
MPDNEPTNNSDISHADTKTIKLKVDSSETDPSSASQNSEIPTKVAAIPENATELGSEFESLLECSGPDDWPPGSKGATLQAAYWNAVRSGDATTRRKAAEDYLAFVQSQEDEAERKAKVESTPPQRDDQSRPPRVLTWRVLQIR